MRPASVLALPAWIPEAFWLAAATRANPGRGCGFGLEEELWMRFLLVAGGVALAVAAGAFCAAWATSLEWPREARQVNPCDPGSRETS